MDGGGDPATVAGLTGHVTRYRRLTLIGPDSGAAPGRPAADSPFREASLALLLAMVADEHDPDVLYSITTGLGHIGDERSLAPLTNLHDHPDPEVRYGVAFALLRRPEPAALDTLITLSADQDAQVRDWATFGLARQSEADFPRLRDALADRLADDVDIRLEAINGLATRGDERAMQPLLDILQSPPDSVDPALTSEALCALAIATADPRLRPHLLAERNRFLDDPIDEWPDNLRPALARYGEPPPS